MLVFGNSDCNESVETGEEVVEIFFLDVLWDIANVEAYYHNLLYNNIY